MKSPIKYLSLILVVASLAACSPRMQVDRVSENTQTDLSGKWNDTDARMVSEEMINDVLDKPWYERYKTNNESKTPVVIVGNVRNETMEHIDTEVITKEIERAFVNTGLVNVVATQGEREDVRQERIEQQTHASLETVKALGKELGADYMMIGNISSIVDRSLNKRQQAVFYTVNLELISIETNQKVWIGNKKIKKILSKKGLGS